MIIKTSVNSFFWENMALYLFGVSIGVTFSKYAPEMPIWVFLTPLAISVVVGIYYYIKGQKDDKAKREDA